MRVYDDAGVSYDRFMRLLTFQKKFHWLAVRGLTDHCSWLFGWLVFFSVFPDRFSPLQVSGAVTRLTVYRAATHGRLARIALIAVCSVPNRPLAHWLTGPLAQWLTGSLAHWLTGSPAHWLTGSLAHRLTGPLAHWLTDSLAHWPTGSVASWPTGSLLLVVVVLVVVVLLLLVVVMISGGGGGGGGAVCDWWWWWWWCVCA